MASLRLVEDAQKLVNSRLDEQEWLLAQFLMMAGAAASVADAERWFTAAHCLAVMSARHETLDEFVHELHASLEAYLSFLECETAQLPQFDADSDDELLAAPIARLSWSDEQLRNDKIVLLDRYWKFHERPSYWFGTKWTPLPEYEEAVSIPCIEVGRAFPSGDFPGLERDVAFGLCRACEQWRVQPFYPGPEFEREFSLTTQLERGLVV